VIPEHQTSDQIARTAALAPLMPGSRWAIDPDALPQLVDLAQRAGDAGQLAAALGAASGGRRRGTRGVAVVPLTGILTPRGSVLSLLFGGGAGSLQDFRTEFAKAVADPDVAAIVIDVDSPGGLVDLVPETAADVRAARGRKPIVAVGNTLAASGAYWIASQADEVVVTPSGRAGSIGVYVMHEDRSDFNAKVGLQQTYVSAGRYKTEGNPDEPLGDAAKLALQQSVDDLHRMFVSDVAAGRGTSPQAVAGGYGEGRTLNAQRAVDAGLADRIDTYEAVVGGLLSTAARGASPTPAAAQLPPDLRRIVAELLLLP